jgi:hypothetical protein
MTTPPGNEARLEAQVAREIDDQKKTAVRLVSFAHRHQLTAVELVAIAQSLGLDEELDDLAGTSPERQRLLAAARAAQLELEMDRRLGAAE